MGSVRIEIRDEATHTTGFIFRDIEDKNEEHI